ncbi:hypothetical protein [Kaistella antarctica]|uniref:Uncharacterized protein n=1 Tax=Kaistella antarctica TaxID=266748 RepID=A0A3S4UN75_9FLAO|nr:hypothetical protein [Kaistella antarctica]KEY18084.1 hypothetical protein HY04_06050 [Kaistella antarctica]SEV82608.1 hypothetical protein SAMN05421765_0417 [Kaistella antarctica]VEI00669.1 Uncharacterised protein [Kaistella antarctica]
MKKYFLSAAIISLGLMSCTKSEVNVETVENSDGTSTTTTVEKEKTTSFDSVKINATVDQAQQKLNEAGKKIDEYAKDGRTQFKKAGNDIKDAAAKGAEKVEKGAEKIKDDLNKE